jgi:hypothetical protein
MKQSKQQAAKHRFFQCWIVAILYAGEEEKMVSAVLELLKELLCLLSSVIPCSAL